MICILSRLQFGHRFFALSIIKLTKLSTFGFPRSLHHSREFNGRFNCFLRFSFVGTSYLVRMLVLIRFSHFSVPSRKIGVRHQFLTDEAISGVKVGGPIVSHSLHGDAVAGSRSLRSSSRAVPPATLASPPSVPRSHGQKRGRRPGILDANAAWHSHAS